jgi:hypothetical protein
MTIYDYPRRYHGWLFLFIDRPSKCHKNYNFHLQFPKHLHTKQQTTSKQGFPHQPPTLAYVPNGSPAAAVMPV